jgi:hypothetical protein
MLEAVVSTEGTGIRAASPATASPARPAPRGSRRRRRLFPNRYTAVFGGVAPASAPRLAAWSSSTSRAAGVSTAATSPRRCSRRSSAARCGCSRCRRMRCRAAARRPPSPTLIDSALTRVPAPPAPEVDNTAANVRHASRWRDDDAAHGRNGTARSRICSACSPAASRDPRSRTSRRQPRGAPGAAFVACRGRDHGLRLRRRRGARAGRGRAVGARRAVAAPGCRCASAASRRAAACAPPASSPTASTDRAVGGVERGRHHRHERQDHLAWLLAQARHGRQAMRLRRHARRGPPGPVDAGTHTTPTLHRAARACGCANTAGARVAMEVSSHALAQSASRGRVSHGRVHEPDARPPRLPRQLGRLRRREGAAVHARRRCACGLNVDDAFAARFASALAPGVG